MPYFHATERHRLASILSRGLGGVDLGPRSEDCPRFVYLASHPRLAILIAIMHVVNTLPIITRRVDEGLHTLAAKALRE